MNQFTTTLLTLFITLSCFGADTIREDARSIQVAYDVDVVVTGGSTYAVAAAVAAAETGASVFLVTDRPYLGEDLCMHVDYALPVNKQEDPLVKAIWQGQKQAVPMAIKRGLDRALLDHKIPFLTGSYPAELVTDADGRFAGITIVNRSGRHLVKAKTLIDATDQSIMARQSSASFPAFKPGAVDFRFRVVGGEAPDGLQPVVEPGQGSKTQSTGIIVDDTKAKRVGPWKTSSQRPNHVGERYLTNAKGKGPHSITWKAVLPKPGSYEVRASFCGGNSLATTASYLIHHAKGETALRIDQTTKPTIDGLWFPLGRFHFEAKGAGPVMAEVSLSDKGADSWIIADAVQFVPVDDPHKKDDKPSRIAKVVRQAGLTAARVDQKIQAPKKGSFGVTEYLYRTELKTGDWSEIAKVEQRLRNLCRTRGMEESSEGMRYDLGIQLSHLPGLGRWPGASAVDLKHFVDSNAPAIVVLGKYAALNPEVSRAMLRVDQAVPLGRRLGAHAAKLAKSLPERTPVKSANSVAGAKTDGEVRYHTRDLRTPQKRTYTKLEAQGLPILGEYDVVVVGGGTSGAPAAIGAAEAGAKTLLIEYLDELGGVGTAGMVAKYWYGLRHGFTQRIDNAIRATDKGWDIVDKSEWLRQTAVRAGSDVWFRSYGCGAVVDGNQVRGIVVATPFGRGVVMAKTVIDGTGNSDIPVHAGAKTRYSIDSNGIFSVQLAGFPVRGPGENHRNTCYALFDDSDAIDFWHLMLARRHEHKQNHYDAGQLVDSRERRRIIGDYELSAEDILMNRTFPDTLLQMESNFDASNFPTSRLLLLRDVKGPIFTCNMPYRCFLPQGLDGVLSIGLGASAHRDAMTLVRMQPDLQNQGYAIGIAANMAAKLDGKTREVSIKSLQKAVIKQGILSRESYGAKDSLPMGKDAVLAAVGPAVTASRTVNQKKEKRDLRPFTSLAILLAHPEVSIPALRERMKKANSDTERLNCASILATLGDESGRQILIDAVNKAKWVGGDHLTNHRATKNAFSDANRLIMALGHCEGEAVRKALIAKLSTLTAKNPASDFVAISHALRQHNGPDLAADLSRLAKEFGPKLQVRRYGEGDRMLTRRSTSVKPGTEMNIAVKELIAAGMLTAAGDKDGQGKAVLQAYTQEISGQLARYAEYLLAQLTDIKQAQK